MQTEHIQSLRFAKAPRVYSRSSFESVLTHTLSFSHTYVYLEEEADICEGTICVLAQLIRINPNSLSFCLSLSLARSISFSFSLTHVYLEEEEADICQGNILIIAQLIKSVHTLSLSLTHTHVCTLRRRQVFAKAP